MLGFASVAVLSGVLVSLSRQLNGRLSLSTSALHSSFWNHLVGLVFLTLIGVVFGGLFIGDPWGAPWWAYWGGPIGFVFIAASRRKYRSAHHRCGLDPRRDAGRPQRAKGIKPTDRLQWPRFSHGM